MFKNYHGFKYGMQFTEAIDIKIAKQMRAQLRVVVNGLEINGMDRTEAKTRVWTAVAGLLGVEGCDDSGIHGDDLISIGKAIQPIMDKVANLEQAVKAAMGVDEEDEDEDGSDGDDEEPDETDGPDSNASEPIVDFDQFSEKPAIEE